MKKSISLDQATTDNYWMGQALKLAKKAAKKDEVPVGAILIGSDGQILSKSGNLREKLNSPIAHAEIICLHRAAKNLNSWRLNESTLYVTLEPCPMCAGAIVQARVGRLVFATPDPKAGASGSIYNITNDSRLNHRCQVESGILAEESAKLLKDFFKTKRKKITK